LTETKTFQNIQTIEKLQKIHFTTTVKALLLVVDLIVVSE